MATVQAPGPSSLPVASIQILRAVAALGVLGHHVANEGATRLGSRHPLPDFSAGAAGVDLFFVISGFIMVYASDGLFARAGAPSSFFTRRLARIVPLYWAATAAAIVCFMVFRYAGSLEQLTWQTIAASLLFVPWPRPDGMVLPVHILGWTLNYEMFFYAVFAVALTLTRRNAVFAVTGLFLVLVGAGRAFALPLPFAFWCDPVILEFCFGMMIALAYREGLRLWRPAAAALVIAGFAVLAFGTTTGWPRLLVSGVPAAAIVAGAVLVARPRQGGVIARALVFVGDASYSIYLVHWLAILALTSLVAYLRLDIAAAPWTYLAAHAVFALATSIVVYLAFERPVTRALRHANAPGAPADAPPRAV
jgi:exopolysaccharide production protein ExoZ